MPLHLVGETLNRHKAHAAAEAGELVSLYRGIYVDASDDIDRTVLEHAVRIAAYLYPQAYLSGASAARLGPTKMDACSSAAAAMGAPVSARWKSSRTRRRTTPPPFRS